MLTRMFLALTTVMFVAFGLWSVTDPVGMTERLAVEIGGPSGVFELRGIYGGVSLGLAILCAIGTLTRRFELPALCAIAAYMGGYVIGRGASLISGDSAGSMNWVFAGYELVMFAIAMLFILRKN